MMLTAESVDLVRLPSPISTEPGPVTENRLSQAIHRSSLKRPRHRGTPLSRPPGTVTCGLPIFQKPGGRPGGQTCNGLADDEKKTRYLLGSHALF